MTTDIQDDDHPQNEFEAMVIHQVLQTLRSLPPAGRQDMVQVILEMRSDKGLIDRVMALIRDKTKRL